MDDELDTTCPLHGCALLDGAVPVFELRPLRWTSTLRYTGHRKENTHASAGHVIFSVTHSSPRRAGR
jgi:hypothetical protein